MKINVLWIDDMPNEHFIDWAFEYDDENPIVIHNELSVDEGFNELLKGDVHYEAIILDANCHYGAEDKGKNTKLSALNYALNLITKNSVSIPWFVYTGFGKEGGVLIENAIEPFMSDRRKYDEKPFYNKPSEMDVLFAKIIEVVKNFNDIKYQIEFADVYEDYPRQKQLLKILKFLDKDSGTKETAYHLIRFELEYIFAQCYHKGLILEKYGEKALSQNRHFLCQTELQFIVPYCIQELLYKLVYLCNPESHYIEDCKDEKIDFSKDAPHLEMTTIYDFLDVVYWFNNNLPKTDEDIKELQIKVAFALQKTKAIEKEESLTTCFSSYEGKEMTVEQDEENNYHCGECHLPFKIAEEQKALGRKVVLNHVAKNSNKGSKYPYHASFKLK